MTSVNFALSVVNSQSAVLKVELLAEPAVGEGPVAVAVAEPEAVAVSPSGVAVAVSVAAVVTVTLMITHRRESSPIFMIKPAGFLMTKFPRCVPVVLGAVRLTEISESCPGYVTFKGTEDGAPNISSE